MKITTVGLDLAKSVFTVHGVDGHGNTVLRKTGLAVAWNRWRAMIHRA